MKQTLVLTASTLAIAEANGLDAQARRQRTLTAEDGAPIWTPSSPLWPSMRPSFRIC